MRDVQIKNKLDALHLGKASRLYPLISAKTKLSFESDSNTEEPFWSASWWRLDQSRLFADLTFNAQQQVLKACNRTLLNEAYFIEKSGLAYSAKMMLLADSTDTAQLYALIGADEAKHLAWIEPYIAEADKITPYGQFLSFLSSLIEDAPPYLLVYLVQIILEGWGLEHYQRLAKNCQQPMLAQVFNHIVKDEALHHKSGGVLFDVVLFSDEDWQFVGKALRHYAEMVKVGPLGVVEAIDTVVMETRSTRLTSDEVETLLVALQHSDESLRKLELLKKLMRVPGMESLVDELENEGYFLPLSIQEAASVYLSSIG